MKINLEHKDLELIASMVVNKLKPLLKVPEPETMYSVKELSEYLGVKNSWVYSRVEKYKIPHIKVGKYPRFKKSEIDKWLKEQSVQIL